jgi:protein-S-isoprenylcysteine O-methyltransferase Ste14
MPTRKVLPAPLQIGAAGLVTAALLFIPAGTLDWWQAWAFLGSFVVFATLSTLLYRDSPELLEERRTASKKAKAWDKPLVLLAVAVLPLVMLVLAGLDRRWGWTPPLRAWQSLLALALLVAGNALVHASMRANRFFSSFARIQSERGHQVVSAGPYRWVRHPGYAGLILGSLAAPLLLGSWPALGVGVLIGLVYVIRTALEDRMLREELEGYEAYAARVRHRLAPWVW